MSKKVPLSQHRKCWVPFCSNIFDYKKKFYTLSSIQPPALREIWLALAAKPKDGLTDDSIFFCEEHFQISNVPFCINNITYTQQTQQSVVIPNNKMPAKICRICNEFIKPNDFLYTVSSRFASTAPQQTEAELKSMVSINQKPLYDVFKSCFHDFSLPTDPISIICKNCYELVWLFIAFKERANEVEEILSTDLTAEEYGQVFLCRCCTTDGCPDFFPVDKETDLGKFLQNLFLKNYPPDIVSLRVCLNCHNILQKLLKFYKKWHITEKVIKKRALLNAKLKASPIDINIPTSTPTHAPTPTPTPPTSTPSKTETPRQKIKKVEAENIIFAKLMLEHGQVLKKNIHNIENWRTVCKKLEEQGINHNVPSLINNWKKLSSKTFEKFRKGTTLSELEKLVLQYEQFKEPLKVTTIKESSEKLLERASVISFSSPSSLNSNLGSIESDRFQEVNNLMQNKVYDFPIEVQKLFLRLLREEYREMAEMQSKGKFVILDKNNFHIFLERIASKGKFPSGDVIDIQRLLHFMILKAKDVQDSGNPLFSFYEEFRSLQKSISTLANPGNLQKPPQEQTHFPITPSHKNKPFSIKDKFDLIHVMTQYRNKTGIQGDPSTRTDIWPEVIKLLKEKGNERDLDSVKNAWNEMKVNATKAALANQLLDDIDRHMILFMKKNTPNNVGNQKPQIDTMKQENDVTVTTAKPWTKKKFSQMVMKTLRKPTKPPSTSLADRPKKIARSPSTPSADQKRKPGRPRLTSSTEKLTKPDKSPLISLADKLQFARAMRNEYNLMTLDERIKRKGLWKDLILVVKEKHFPHMTLARLLNLWGRLKTSATIHIKDGSDPVDVEIWDLLTKHAELKSKDSPTKTPIKNGLDNKALGSNPTISSPKSHKRSIENELASCVASNQNDSDTTSVISDTRTVLPKKPKIESNRELIGKTTTPNGKTDNNKRGPPDSPAKYKDQTALRRLLLMKLKDTFKELRDKGELKESFRIWQFIFEKLYSSGFNVIDRPSAEMMWTCIKSQAYNDTNRNKAAPSEFSKEVNRFLLKVKTAKLSIKNNEPSNSVGMKKHIYKKKKPYENDVPYRPGKTLNDTVTKKISGETPRAPVLIKGDNNFEGNKESDESFSRKAWSPEETKIYVSVVTQFWSIKNSRSFWPSLIETCQKKGLNRTENAMKQLLPKLLRRIESKKSQELALSETERALDTLNKMSDMKNRLDDGKDHDGDNHDGDHHDGDHHDGDHHDGDNHDGDDSDVNVGNDSTMNETSTDNSNDAANSNQELKNEINSKVIKTESKLPISAAQNNTFVDLSYDYVSLADLQLSTTWDVPPTLMPMVDEKPEQDKMDTKLEDVINFEASGSNVATEEDSRDSEGDDQPNDGYVSAKDLGMVMINLTESDEE